MRYLSCRTTVLIFVLVRFAQPEVNVLVVQQRQTEDHRQQIKEVVVPRQNDENLKQHLIDGKKNIEQKVFSAGQFVSRAEVRLTCV